MRLGVEIVKRAPVPKTALKPKSGTVMINRDRIGGVGLKFDGVRASGGGRFNELKRPVKRAVMVSDSSQMMGG